MAVGSTRINMSQHSSLGDKRLGLLLQVTRWTNSLLHVAAGGLASVHIFLFSAPYGGLKLVSNLFTAFSRIHVTY